MESGKPKQSVVNLRALEPEDLDLLYTIENDRELWDVGSTNVPYSRYVLHDYISSARGDIYADRQVRLMVENSDGDVVGIADMVNFEPRHMRAEVGIVIRKPFRNHGYAHSALDQLAHYALHVLHLHQLYAYVAADNEDSRTLFLQAGYRHSSLLRDWLCDGDKYRDALLLQKIL